MYFLRLSILCKFMIFLSLELSLFEFVSVLSSTSIVSATSDTTDNTDTSNSNNPSHTTNGNTPTVSSDSQPTGSSTADSQTTGESTTDSQSTGESTTDSQSTGESTTDSQSTGESTTDKQSTGESTTDKQSTGESTTNKQSTGESTTDNQSTGESTTDKQSTGESTTNNQSTGESTTDKQSTGESTTDSQSTGESTIDSQTTGESTTNKQSTGESTTDSQATGESTTDSQTTGESTTNKQSTGESTTDSQTTGESTTNKQTTGESTSNKQSTGESTTDKQSTGESTTDSQTTSSNTALSQPTSPNTADSQPTRPSTTENMTTGSVTSKATSNPSTTVSITTVLTSTVTPLTTMAPILIQTPDVHLPFKIKFNNALYNDELKDKTSSYYKEVSANYTAQLTSAYNETDGFTAVEIRSFRNGSLIVDYIVKFKYNKDNTTQLLENLNSTVLSKLLNISGVDQDYLESRYERDLENAKYQCLDAGEDLCSLNNACPEGYTCVNYDYSRVKCTSLCANHNCQNNGICNVNVNKEPICSCIEDDNYIYGGEYCTEKAEKLSMESETIIAIAAGVGGGIILILLVALIAMCCRRKNPKDKIGESSQMSILPMTEIGDDDAALITRDTSLNTDLATSRLYRDTKAAPSNLREVVPVASFEDDGRSRSGREMRYGDDGRMYHSIPENQIYGMASAGRGYTNKALEGDNDQTMAYFYQPEKLSRFGMESSDVNRNRQDETARYSSAPTRDDRSQYISDSAPKREIEPDYFDWSNGAPRSTQEPRFTHTNIDKANTGDPRGHYKSGVDPRTQQQPSSRPYSPDSSAPSYYNDPPQRSNVYDYILAEKPISIRRPTLMPQKR